jgi:hypothetical protein
MKRLLGAALAAMALCGETRADEAPADPRAVIQSTIEKLFELKPELRTVEVTGFAGRNGHSLCDTALTDALLVGLDEEARNPNRALRDRPLTVRRAGSGAAGPEGEVATASGLLDVDARGKAFINMGFLQGRAILAPSGRVAVALDKLGCDPAMRPFLEHVAAGARTDRERLDVTAPVFGVGQRLEIAITLKRSARLYCWVLDEDETGFVMLPAGGTANPTEPGTYRYPRDFQLGDVVLHNRFENLVSCFSATEPLPEALAAEWSRHSPAAANAPILMRAETVRSMMDEMRRTPGVSEAAARVVVR